MNRYLFFTFFTTIVCLPFQLIRGMSGTKGNSLRMTEADMKLLLASKQQLQAQKAGVVTTSQQQSVTQLLQGIQSGQVCQIFFKFVL